MIAMCIGNAFGAKKVNPFEMVNYSKEFITRHFWIEDDMSGKQYRITDVQVDVDGEPIVVHCKDVTDIRVEYTVRDLLDPFVRTMRKSDVDDLLNIADRAIGYNIVMHTRI